MGLKVWASLKDRGPSLKRYKMRCLQMPLFWFVSFANEIKRIRDKTFYFDIWLEPNPCIWHTSRIYGAGCNSKKLRGICISKVLPLLLEKWATTCLLSQNLFYHLQANGEWLTILESLKKKRKQTRVLLQANPTNNKRYNLYGVHPGFLPQTSPGDLFLLSSSLLSLPFRVRLLPRVNLGLFLYHYLYIFLPCLHVQFLEDMCTSSLDCWIHYGWWKLTKE